MKSNMLFYLCFYHVYFGHHVNYHHVLISESEEEHITDLNAGEYLYNLRSRVPMKLTSEELGNAVIKGLVMDGESLTKRLKKFNKQAKNESR